MTGPLHAFATLVAFALAAGGAGASPVVFNDGAGDAVIRRTDPGNDGPFDPVLHRLPDIVEMRLGRFEPAEPHIDPFLGIWTETGEFVRFDMVLDGLINPHDGHDDDDFIYEPFRFGPNPLHGYVEFDVDADENTGGDYEDQRYRYLGNVARFGGVPAEARFAGRAALCDRDLSSPLAVGPFCEFSGEEFHITFEEEIDYVIVMLERPGGDPWLFEAGEIWWIRGEFFHRAHAFDDFTISCSDDPDDYEPDVYLRYAHSEATDQTTVSLVFPRTNVGAAALISPLTQPQPNDGCDDNQVSFLECLTDLNFSASFADPWHQQQPQFQFLAGWASKTPSEHLDPAQWRVTALVATAYDSFQSFSTNAIYTDVYPNVVPGDFTGDGIVDEADDVAKGLFVAEHDGDPAYDADATAGNGQLVWPNFARGFCVYDVDYVGLVEAGLLLLGDMDINLVVDAEDVDDWLQGLFEPGVYQDTHGGADPLLRGDMNQDGAMDGADLQAFVDAILAI